ncbi:MAG: EAL domain-containing protein [Candidatus Thiodiazotropha taylori]
MKSIKFIAALIFLIGLQAGLLLFDYWREIDHQLERAEATRQTVITTVLKSYRRIIEVFHKERFNQPPTASLLAKAANSDEQQQVELRKRLYQRFITSYKHLQQEGIHGLQFILPDGRIFLRFDEPGQFGDVILEHRPMLKGALSGFPQGGVLEYDPASPSHRFAFPILHQDQVVGIIDFGVAFEAIRKTLRQLSTMQETHFLLVLKRELYETVTNPQLNPAYRTTRINPGLLLEVTRQSHDQLSSLNKIEAQLETKAPLHLALDQNQAFTEEICIKADECFIVSLQALWDNRQMASGYILSYSAVTELRNLRSKHLTLFLIGIILTSLALYAFNHWLQTTRRLQTISDHMAEGMYVTDTKGYINYVNPKACNILSYKKHQLLGQNAHQLFHCNEQGKSLADQPCMILQHNLSGDHCHSEELHFKCRDGRTIRTSIVCSPIWSNGSLAGSVVLFRDITREHETKRRQYRSDVALSSLAEGVMVTDADAKIEAVNKAFSQITGYQEEEVLGKRPNFLKSGQHDDLFYEEMWDRLILDGHWEGEIWNRRKNGQIYPELLRITSVVGEAGNVSSYVATFSDVTEKRRHEMELHNLAYTDPLTQLHNRAAFLEMFDHALAHTERRNTRCALLYLDLDRFKKINDTLGHDMGDKVLQISAERLNQAVRNNDEVARLGGDEFIVLLEDIHHDDAPARVARKIISLLSQPINLEPHTLHITTSIGIAIYPDDGDDTTTLLKNADAAMYMAKREGRNGYHYFTKAMAKKEENRFKLEIDLHTALMNDEFLLRYQPKVDLYSGETTGFEALLYWQHPQRGLLSAGEFLSVAHDAGVMREITHWVINEACSQMQSWLDQGLNPGRMAINIDTHTFNSSDAYDQICRTVEMSGVSPHSIELEIAESGLLEKPFDDPFWDQLVKLGFTLSIDDFGTGVSSLYRLKRLPVTTLKIDQSFIQNIEHDEQDRSIICTVIAMGKSLGLKILAEGVENHRQLHFLSEIGCDEGQGHLFSKPQPPLMITDLLSSDHYKQLVEVSANQ